jgi:CheY-like chemotaxis protein
MPRILVIDDEPLVLRMIERVLRRAGYEVEVAANGVDGLHAFRRTKPDLVITDMLMPVKEGGDTIRLLRTWAPGVKIIAISGGSRLGSTDLLAQAASLGAVSIVAKPFEPSELVDEVSRLIAVAA